MDYLTTFMSDLEKVPELNATLERWLYGTKELERRMSERVVSLLRYFDRIPEVSMSRYVDSLIEILEGSKINENFFHSQYLDKSITKFIKYLEKSDSIMMRQKAKTIIELMSTKFQIMI